MKKEYIITVKLTADEGYMLTTDRVEFTKATHIPEDEASKWYEITKEECRRIMEEQEKAAEQFN